MTIDAPQPDHEGAARAAKRFVTGAEPDVAYTVADLPVGRVLIAGTENGLARIAYEDLNGSIDEILQQLSDRLSPRILEQPGRLEGIRRELDEYFAGTRREFDIKLDWALIRGKFGAEVLRATNAIAFGETSTYSQIAEQAGNAAASRATGNALGSNPIPIVIPCHRVLRSGGGLGGYTGGLHRKEALLELERA